MRVGVLVSGRGTNLAALLAAEAAGTLAPAEIVVVISNKPGVRALEIATAAGKPALVIEHKGVSREQITENCGWPIKFAADVAETPVPTETELAVLRDINARTKKAHAGEGKEAA